MLHLRYHGISVTFTAGDDSVEERGLHPVRLVTLFKTKLHHILNFAPIKQQLTTDTPCTQRSHSASRWLNHTSENLLHP